LLLVLRKLPIVERVKGIEPSSSAWKAVALPLSYTRIAPLYLSRFGCHRSRTLPSALAPGLHGLRKPAMPEGRENQLVTQTGRPDLTLPYASGALVLFGPNRLRALPFPTQAGLAVGTERLPCSHSRPISAVLQASNQSSLPFRSSARVTDGVLPLRLIARRNLATVAPGREVPSRRQVFMAWDGRARSIGRSCFTRAAI
jgi:hypothetical protein